MSQNCKHMKRCIRERKGVTGKGWGMVRDAMAAHPHSARVHLEENVDPDTVDSDGESRFMRDQMKELGFGSRRCAQGILNFLKT